MPYEPSARTRASAAALFLLVISILIAPLGALVINAVADTGGGTASSSVTPDTTSDQVAATAAEFRVDESGSATYSIPIYGVPGTAGVAPKISLNYSSQGGYGPLGKGWSIGGLSSISRCRATHEAGDPDADGFPSPVNFSAGDRYCLDGQRLLPAPAASPACATVSGMSVAGLRTEIESFQRVCAYTPASTPTKGPAFFTAERKDGSISWYGDRSSSAGANRTDGYFETNSPLNGTAALLWAQTRLQDSTGNYIDFLYAENLSGTTTREHLISEIHYTGKTVLSGQAGNAVTPYAKIVFTYTERPAVQRSKGFVSGGTVDQIRRLDSITACAAGGGGACPVAQQARFYKLAYAASGSGNGLENMTSIQECRDSSLNVCMPATSFAWSQARNEFATSEDPVSTLGNWFSPFHGMKWGDVDGDGRQDMVYILEGTCSTEAVFVAFSTLTLDAANRMTFERNPGKYTCTPAELLPERGNGSWHLLDYNGDGLDDLMVSAADGQPWRIYPSRGRTGHATKIFDDSQNLLTGLSPAIPSESAEDRQLQLADLNGDGLSDIIYPDGSQLAARLMTRNGSSFTFGGVRSIQLEGAAQNCMGPNTTCTFWYEPTSFMGFNQLFDMNGDGSSDVLVQVNKNVTRHPEPGCVPEPGLPCVPTTTMYVSVWPYVVSEITPAQIKLTTYGTSAQPIIPTSQAGDFNGDGLTDFLTVNETTGIVLHTINTGVGFQAWTNLGAFPNPKHLKVIDANGDGRSDLVYPNTVGANKAFVARLALPQGGFAAESALQGGNAIHCAGSSCNADEKMSLFGDYDGDGAVEHVRFSPSDSNTGVHVSRAGTASQFVPRDVITQITNGLGAQTSIEYAALTNKDLYRRDTNSRMLEWGRGSPVMDFLAPTYAVAKVKSSSPRVGAPAGEAAVHYRYAGARVQAGGRGFLGFRVIESIDPNQVGGYIVTATDYFQGFPLTGMPGRTLKKVVSGPDYQVPVCLNGSAITNACFTTPGQLHADLGGSWFSDSQHIWEMNQPNLDAQLPLHVRTLTTEEKLRDPFAGGQTSWIATGFEYGGYGNVTKTTVETFTGAETAPMSTVVTANTYADDLAKWRLGRLTGTTVTHSRPGQPNVVRTANFAYSMGGAATGQLTVERTQYNGAVDQDLRKEYTYDEYGNQTVAETCANPATACSTTINFHPATATTIQRYARTTYDSIGRFPVTKVEPFWNGTGAVEKTVSTVVARNIYGDVTQAYDLNGVDSLAVTGAMGRPYYTWTETVAGSTPGSAASGGESWTTYRFCGTGSGQVNCPTGAKFRQRVSAEGAGRQWTYFDVLGRPVMKAAETFNTNVIGKDVSATCTDYDAKGRPERASNPFFLAGTGGTDGPTGLDGVCTDLARLWTTTTYDLLGRPTRVESPDDVGMAAVTNAYHNNTTGSRDARTNLTNTVRNGKGEIWQVVDASGLLMVNYYTADGNLVAVHRNAGRGIVANQFSFDALGRKISQTDPDSGFSQFQYNALGELIVQIDNSGQRIENEYDARGRVWRRTVKTATGAIETQSTFTFDTAVNGVGQLASESITGTYAGWNAQAGMALGYSRSATYDSLGRGLTTTTTIDGVAYGTLASYDALGRAYRGQDASGRWIKTEYNARGFVRAVCNSIATDTAPTCPADTNTYVATLATDEWGHVTKERRGNSTALEVNRTYYAGNGRVAEICGGTSAGCNLIKEGYGWDPAGNLTTHGKEARYVETFTYDSLNRLRTAHLTQQDGALVNQLMQNYEYDQLGNICHRDTYGWASRDYTYSGRAGCGLGGANSTQGSGGTGILGPHQATALVDATTLDQYYDANGNMIQRNGPVAGNDWVLKYTASNQAYEITKDTGERMRFWYGPGGARYKSEDGAKKTLYLGNVEIVTNGGVVTTRRTIAGVMLQTVIGATATNYYLFHDQLGSVVRIANAAGAVVSSMDFLAFGGRRNTDTQAANGTAPSLTPRGFTGHEMLDSVGLIHMNGRIYDQYLGRFLQPDPLIQAPNNVQSWNAYTYVFNNPLVYTDPTGAFSIDNFVNYLSMALNVASLFFPPLAPMAAAMSIVVQGYNTASAFYDGGMKYGLIAAFTPTINTGNIFIDVAGNAVVAGVRSEATGGSFRQGAVGALQSAAVSFVVSAIAAGTRSAQTGGKYANGADTESMQGAVVGVGRNEVPGQQSGPVVTVITREQQEEFYALVKKLGGARYDSIGLADQSFTRTFLPFTEKHGFEVGANITSIGVKFSLEDITLGGSTYVATPFNRMTVRDVHTHPSWGGDGFSGTLRYVDKRLLTYYQGDYGRSWQHGAYSSIYQGSFVHRAGDNAMWTFDYIGFRNSYLSSQKSGADTYAEWFTKRTR